MNNDILLKIAETSSWAFNLMARSIPIIGIYSLKSTVQRRMRRAWTIKKDLGDVVTYRLPNGCKYRDIEDGPAHIEYALTLEGKLKKKEIWYTLGYGNGMGKRHRLNNPACITYHSSEDHSSVKEHPHSSVEEHSHSSTEECGHSCSSIEEHPHSSIEEHSCSSIEEQEWWNSENGVEKRYRFNKPALIKYKRNGKVWFEQWYQSSLEEKSKTIVHREDGGVWEWA